jgi:ribose transport system ATP-binding protein
MSSAPALAATSITQRYDQTVVLDDVALRVQRGEVVGLLGENGAGKTTLLDILSGVRAPHAGEVAVAGEPVRLRSHRQANALGIFRVFQEGAVVGELDAVANIFLGHERRAGRRLSRRAMVAATRRAVEQLDDGLDLGVPVSTMSVGERQLLEVARVLALVEHYESPSPVILLDEPTTALDHGQEQRLLLAVERLRGRAAFVFVSHRLDEVLRICDRLVVLKDGRNAGERSAAGATEPQLHALMVGRDRAANHFRDDRRRPPEAGTVLEVDGLALDGRFGPVSLSVARGEILGVAGLLGSGKAALARCVAGDLRPTAGTVRVEGRALERGGVRHAIDRGIAFVPGERGAEGLVLDDSSLGNIRLASVRDRLRGPLGTWRQREAVAITRGFTERLRVVPPEPEAIVGTLSGGNQQKILLAKWVAREPRVLVVENPTRGVDTGAREEIYALLRDQAAAGVAVLLVSDDLTELIGLSERIVVMGGGTIAEIVGAPPHAKPGEERLLAPMLEGHRDRSAA